MTLSGIGQNRHIDTLINSPIGNKNAANKSANALGSSGGGARTYNVNPEDFIMPGMNITGKKLSDYSEIIEISDDVRQKTFDNVKADLIRNMGLTDGEGRSEIAHEHQLSIPAEDRLKATYTIGEYRFAYGEAMISAIKESDPEWEPGKPFNESVLDSLAWDSITIPLGWKNPTGVDALA